MWRVRPTAATSSSPTSSSARIGMFNDPRCPTSRAVDTFTGPSFHSASWDDDHDLTAARRGDRERGERGAARPRGGEGRGRLVVFQRTANWVLPEGGRPYTDERLDASATDPHASARGAGRRSRAHRATITLLDPDILTQPRRRGPANLEVVTDPEVRAKLTPKMPWGCHARSCRTTTTRRSTCPTSSSSPTPITEITPSGVVTADGARAEVDVDHLRDRLRRPRGTSTHRGDRRGRQPLAGRLGRRPGGVPRVRSPASRTCSCSTGPTRTTGRSCCMLECQVEYVHARSSSASTRGTRRGSTSGPR